MAGLTGFRRGKRNRNAQRIDNSSGAVTSFQPEGLECARRPRVAWLLRHTRTLKLPDGKGCQVLVVARGPRKEPREVTNPRAAPLRSGDVQVEDAKRRMDSRRDFRAAGLCIQIDTLDEQTQPRIVRAASGGRRIPFEARPMVSSGLSRHGLGDGRSRGPTSAVTLKKATRRGPSRNSWRAGKAGRGGLYSPGPASQTPVDAAIAIVHRALLRLPRRFHLDAVMFHRGLHEELRRDGCRSRREFNVELDGDRDGRIDLLITEPLLIAIELDRRRPRQKSIRKLRIIDGVPLVVLGQPARRPMKCPSGVDAVLGARPYPWVARRREMYSGKLAGLPAAWARQTPRPAP